MKLQGAYCWVIGASAGIGESLTRALAKEGAHLALSARSEEKLTALTSELSGEKNLALPCDVTDEQSLQSCFETIQNEWPQLDVVIYLAGTYTPATISEYDAARSVQVINVNVQGLLRALGLVLPYFIEQKSGRLVLFGSVAGYRGLPNSPDYCASKAAINVLAESLDVDLAPYGVKVQLVCPGFVKTRLTDQNEFPMPCRISTEEAAARTIRGLKKDQFEIHYPKRFTYFMKLLRIVPTALYRTLVHKLT